MTNTPFLHSLAISSYHLTLRTAATLCKGHSLTRHRGHHYRGCVRLQRVLHPPSKSMGRYNLVLACILCWAMAVSGRKFHRTKSSLADVVTQSHGMPWPMPQMYSSSNTSLPVDAGSFVFNAPGVSCDILQEAFVRYIKLTFGNRPENKVLVFKPRQRAGVISQLTVVVSKSCEKVYPALESDESYKLTVSAGEAVLTAPEVWGALRGLETFSQIVYQNNNGEFLVNETDITDFPRFHHRGTLLDTSTHFLSVDSIKMNLDAMAMNKMNVFHWHIVDDQSFPYQSFYFPALSNKGAYDPATHVYSQTDVKEVIEYARLRGIRVLPEFDSPGHTLSWSLGQPGLLTPCYSKGSPDGSFGPVNPAFNFSYVFMSQLFQEVSQVFPDQYVHLGGDEVDFQCWKTNPDVTSFMDKMGFLRDYSKLEQYYVQNVANIVKGLKRGTMIWQEVIDDGALVERDTWVEVWKDGWQSEMSHVTKLGYKTLLASCWYLNIISYGTDWPKYYECDPHEFTGTEEQKALVQGGEAAMWGEYVDDTNVISTFWPRACAAAERLWSAASVRDRRAATPRLEEMRCRMVRRGIPAAPVNGPSSCRKEFRPAH